MVDRRELGIQPLTNLLNMAVLPTPESPTNTIFLNAKDADLKFLSVEVAS